MPENVNEGEPQSLLDLINQTAYQPGPSQFGDDVSGETDNLASGLGQDGLSPVVQNEAAAPQDQASGQSVTPPEPIAPSAETTPPPVTPGLSAAQIEAMQQTIQQQNQYITMHQRAIAAERERQFQLELQEMSPEEQRAALAERKAQQLEAQNRQLSTRAQQQEVERQDTAKRILAIDIAAENGLDISLSKYLLSANSLEEMEATAQDLKARFAPAQPVAAPVPEAPVAPQAPDPAAFVAGGSTGPGSVPEEIEPGSGNLLGLIRQTQYQSVNFD